MGILSELFVRVGMDGTDRVKIGMTQIGQSVDSAAQKMEKAGGVFQRFGSTAQKVFGSAAAAGKQFAPVLFDHVGRGFDVATKAAVGFGVAAGAALLVGGKSAAQASIEYESLVAQMESLTGTAEVAARKLDFVQKVAGPSNFTFKQLSQATATMEALGINSERVLPTIARLGMAFNANNDQLQTLVKGLGDVAAGGFFEKDVAASFGLNRAMFMEKGVKFDNTGALVSSASEAMTALEKIVNERYGNIFDKMGDTAGTKLASLQDIWDKYSRITGDKLMKGLMPAINYLSNLLDGALDNGAFVTMLDGFGDGMERLWTKITGGKDIFDGITRAIAGTMALVENLPDIFIKVMDVFPVIGHNLKALTGTIWDSFKGIGDGIGKGFKGIGDWFAKSFSTTFDWMESRMDGILKKYSPIMKAVGISTATAVNPLFGSTLMTADYTSQFVQDAAEKTAKKNEFRSFGFNELWDKMGKDNKSYYHLLTSGSEASSKKVFDVPAGSGDFFNRAMEAPKKENSAEKLLTSIEENTRKAADTLSLRRQALGGGPLGAIGITPAEYYSGVRAPDYVPERMERLRQPTGNGIGQAIQAEVVKLVERKFLNNTYQRSQEERFHPRGL